MAYVSNSIAKVTATRDEGISYCARILWGNRGSIFAVSWTKREHIFLSAATSYPPVLFANQGNLSG